MKDVMLKLAYRMKYEEFLKNVHKRLSIDNGIRTLYSKKGNLFIINYSRLSRELFCIQDINIKINHAGLTPTFKVNHTDFIPIRDKIINHYIYQFDLKNNSREGLLNEKIKGLYKYLHNYENLYHSLSQDLHSNQKFLYEIENSNIMKFSKMKKEFEDLDKLNSYSFK